MASFLVTASSFSAFKKIYIINTGQSFILTKQIISWKYEAVFIYFCLSVLPRRAYCVVASSLTAPELHLL